MLGQDRIIKVDIEKEMRTSYIDYSMSVIVARALPDVRDGFKPVHRRVLFGMNELGVTSNKPYKKSARIVGEVLGKYHPHGDSSVYFTMVRLAQEWVMRYPLVDGQGNFGSVDGDSPAAMRYTEARLRKFAEEILVDLDKDTVDFVNNFDDTLREPSVLPTRIPNMLVNGASGIAVGMATNIAPHNLSECVDGICAYIDNPEIDTDGLMQFIKGPDFPTGGIIYGINGIREGFETGRGHLTVRSKTEIETDANGREKIIVTEIPYMVNKAEMIKDIAELIKSQKVEGISNINDESDRQGMRIVIDIKKEANAKVVLNRLFKNSQLQSSFSVNNIALVKGRPQLLTLKDMIHYFVEHRHEVVVRRTRFELAEAEKRAHILKGLIIAVDNIDEVVSIIRNSQSVDQAKKSLIERFSLDEEQAKAIVEMRLRQLTGLAIDDLKSEFNDLEIKIADLKDILGSEERQMKIVKEELIEVKEKYGDERRTEIDPRGANFNVEDFYADDDMVITISHLGYIKRTALSEYKEQHRGGVGVKGSGSRDEDFIEHIYMASMHQTLLLFTKKGRCYWLKVYEIPEYEKNAKGRAIQNLLNIDSDDAVTAYISTKQLQDEEFNKSHYLIFATKQGVVKKTSLEAYSRPRANGVIAISLREDDQVIQVRLTSGNSEILMANKNGRAIHFNEQNVREMGRTATGVRGMRLDAEDGSDEIVGMVSVEPNSEESVLVVSEKGFGKRSMVEDYRITNRGGKGVRTLNITEKTGLVVTINAVTDNNDLMIINKSGMTIRTACADLRIMGRATQGVKLINLSKRNQNDEIASVCIVDHEEVPAEGQEGGSDSAETSSENGNSENQE
ncbi:MAG: DNA gyrase subunit A [Paludibacteraceae bacterium]|nr:DNA gyrase subunit A [Paludibacteraceae bacterium]